MITTLLSRRLFGIAIASMFVLAACGGGGDDASGAEVASVSDTENGADAGESASGVQGGDIPEEIDAQTAFLRYAECMRIEGIDYPDPTFNADGRIERGSFQIDRTQDGFDEADDACRGELDGAALGGGGRGFGPGGFEAIQEGMLGFTACIRDEGVAVDDLTFNQPGQGGPGGQGGQGGPGGQPGQGGPGGQGGPDVNRDEGQRTERLAGRLGLDVDDPDVAAALETCEPILDDIFAGLGDRGNG